MNFDLSAYDDFRSEIDAWCRKRWPNGMAPRVWAGGHRGDIWAKSYRDSMRGLGEKGWLCGGWPREWGGGGWHVIKQAVFNEEAAYHGIPGTGLTNSAVSIIGPTIMHYGSAAQRAMYLPPITRGEVRWGLGFSEPNAGSDLAGLQTRAVADGDDFVVNGAKIWNSSKDTDYVLLLARTDPEAPKHRGITQFILPLKNRPGVTIQPIRDLLDDERWTLVTFEDVRLGRDHVIGEVNRGWYQETTSLDLERAQMGWLGEARRTLDELVSMARGKNAGGAILTTNPFVRDRLGELIVELEMARWLAYRVVAMQSKGMIPNSEASMSKLWSSEVQQHIQRAGKNILGAIGLLRDQSPPQGSEWDFEYWDAVGTTIAGGTSEVQRNIIAQRGLGLPR